MKNIVLVFIVLISACSACEVKEGQDKESNQNKIKPTNQTETKPVQEESFDFDEFFTSIDTVNACVAKNEGFSGLSLRLDKGIQAPIYKINSAKTLKKLFYLADKKQEETESKKEVRCSDKNAVIIDRTLKRLGKLETNESTMVLIELYQDTSLAFVGNEAKTLMRVMSRGGDEMLELLEPIEDLRPRIGKSIVTSLKNGKPLY